MPSIDNQLFKNFLTRRKIRYCRFIRTILVNMGVTQEVGINPLVDHEGHPNLKGLAETAGTTRKINSH